MGGKYVGAVVRRREDPRFLAGRGRYVDDLRVPACLHAAVLRSPHAHARIRMIRLGRTRAHPAVVACFTYEDLTPPLQPLPVAGAPPPLLIETVHLEHPSPRNPLEVKGVGEGGAISPPAALANAVEDALAAFGARITEGPLTPARVWGQTLRRQHSEDRQLGTPPRRAPATPPRTRGPRTAP